MRVHVGVEGDAEAADAWQRYADLDAWPEWSPQVQRVDTGPVHDLAIEDADATRDEDDEDDEDDEPDRAAAESAFTASGPPGTDPVPRRIVRGLRGVVIGPVGVQVPFEVLAVDEDAMTWTWRVRAALTELTLDHSVASRAGGGCRTDLEITGPAPLVLAYAPAARLALTRLVRR